MVGPVLVRRVWSLSRSLLSSCSVTSAFVEAEKSQRDRAVLSQSHLRGPYSQQARRESSLPPSLSPFV